MRMSKARGKQDGQIKKLPEDCVPRHTNSKRQGERRKIHRESRTETQRKTGKNVVSW